VRRCGAIPPTSVICDPRAQPLEAAGLLRYCEAARQKEFHHYEGYRPTCVMTWSPATRPRSPAIIRSVREPVRENL